MTPNPRTPDGIEDACMDQALDDFNRAAAAWLADETKVGLPEAEVMHRAGSGFTAFEAAVAGAIGPGHEGCPTDRRAYNLIVRIVGNDGIPTTHLLAPGIPPGCFLAGLRRDPSVVSVSILGMTRDEP